MSVDKAIGELAQAARNYLLSGSARDKAVLDRLAAKACGRESFWAMCLDCGALVAREKGVCAVCGLGEE